MEDVWALYTTGPYRVSYLGAGGCRSTRLVYDVLCCAHKPSVQGTVWPHATVTHLGLSQVQETVEDHESAGHRADTVHEREGAARALERKRALWASLAKDCHGDHDNAAVDEVAHALAGEDQHDLSAAVGTQLWLDGRALGSRGGRHRVLAAHTKTVPARRARRRVHSGASISKRGVLRCTLLHCKCVVCGEGSRARRAPARAVLFCYAAVQLCTGHEGVYLPCLCNHEVGKVAEG